MQNFLDSANYDNRFKLARSAMAFAEVNGLYIRTTHLSFSLAKKKLENVFIGADGSLDRYFDLDVIRDLSPGGSGRVRAVCVYERVNGDLHRVNVHTILGTEMVPDLDMRNHDTVEDIPFRNYPSLLSFTTTTQTALAPIMPLDTLPISLRYTHEEIEEVLSSSRLDPWAIMRSLLHDNVRFTVIAENRNRATVQFLEHGHGTHAYSVRIRYIDFAPHIEVTGQVECPGLQFMKADYIRDLYLRRRDEIAIETLMDKRKADEALSEAFAAINADAGVASVKKPTTLCERVTAWFGRS